MLCDVCWIVCLLNYCVVLVSSLRCVWLFVCGRISMMNLCMGLWLGVLNVNGYCVWMNSVMVELILLMCVCGIVMFWLRLVELSCLCLISLVWICFVDMLLLCVIW